MFNTVYTCNDCHCSREFFNHQAILTQTAWVWFLFGIISLIQCCFTSMVMEAIYEMFLLEPQFSRVFLNRLLGRINEVRISLIPSICLTRISRSFFSLGLPVRWMILHLWIRKSTEICFRSRPWVSWVFYARSLHLVNVMLWRSTFSERPTWITKTTVACWFIISSIYIYLKLPHAHNFGTFAGGQKFLTFHIVNTNNRP